MIVQLNCNDQQIRYQNLLYYICHLQEILLQQCCIIPSLNAKLLLGISNVVYNCWLFYSKDTSCIASFICYNNLESSKYGDIITNICLQFQSETLPILVVIAQYSQLIIFEVNVLLILRFQGQVSTCFKEFISYVWTYVLFGMIPGQISDHYLF
ncbi:UNKNOWN [Stylonychia lemnae]|uniref:Transmembrane protein n=1 Tax=Stylonychia lemnae TaxID=5949 RepID=A0A078BBX6_STYLE|nr:UNKNOWN [Stylonychia lemnae]|eukprot:CDW91711.1 UNKNOWN [Stylonychia lemnae]